jgi:hypothetical protein
MPSNAYNQKKEDEEPSSEETLEKDVADLEEEIF